MSRRIKRSAIPKLPSSTAPIFAALGDETRLRLIGVLCVGGAMSISQLTLDTEFTRQGVTKHLEVLAAAGLIRDAKVGRERLWEFDPTQLLKALQSLQAIAAQWDGALQRLKAAVER
jgi:DNA-binding transcriptional ArsR family regulator